VEDVGADEHKSQAPKSVMVAIVTVSDTRTEKDDLSGKAISEILTVSGHSVVRKDIVKDDLEQIRAALRELIEDANVQAVILNGGTGVSVKDVTLEAVHDFEEKQLHGFGELFRMLSYEEIGSAAIMSRAAAFVTEGKVVFCLPGSEKAVRLATTKLIAPELGHLVWEANR
jgi:molybdenum cofactor biosynthesis protein B